jgi:hypothetical protein
MGKVLTGDRPATPEAVETTGPRKLSVPEPPRSRPRPAADVEPPGEPPTITPWSESDITPDDAPATRPEASPSKLRGVAGGFKSRAQWRKFFADPRLRRFAHRKAHASKGGPRVRYRILPERKGPPTPGTLR